MALINCPECGNEVSDKANACIHCGNILNESEKRPKKRIIAWYLGLPKYVFYIGIIISLLFIIWGITRVKNEDYEFYYNHKLECVEGLDEAKRAKDDVSTVMYSLESTYDMIIDGYEEMINEDNRKLNVYRIQAVGLSVCGIIISIGSTFGIIRKGREYGSN